MSFESGEDCSQSHEHIPTCTAGGHGGSYNQLKSAQLEESQLTHDQFGEQVLNASQSPRSNSLDYNSEPDLNEVHTDEESEAGMNLQDGPEQSQQRSSDVLTISELEKGSNLEKDGQLERESSSHSIPDGVFPSTPKGQLEKVDTKLTKAAKSQREAHIKREHSCCEVPSTVQDDDFDDIGCNAEVTMGRTCHLGKAKGSSHLQTTPEHQEYQELQVERATAESICLQSVHDRYTLEGRALTRMDGQRHKESECISTGAVEDEPYTQLFLDSEPLSAQINAHHHLEMDRSTKDKTHFGKGDSDITFSESTPSGVAESADFKPTAFAACKVPPVRSNDGLSSVNVITDPGIWVCLDEGCTTNCHGIKWRENAQMKMRRNRTPFVPGEFERKSRRGCTYSGIGDTTVHSSGEWSVPVVLRGCKYKHKHAVFLESNEQEGEQPLLLSRESQKLLRLVKDTEENTVYSKLLEDYLEIRRTESSGLRVFRVDHRATRWNEYQADMHSKTWGHIGKIMNGDDGIFTVDEG